MFGWRRDEGRTLRLRRLLRRSHGRQRRSRTGCSRYPANRLYEQFPITRIRTKRTILLAHEKSGSRCSTRTSAHEQRDLPRVGEEIFEQIYVGGSEPGSTICVRYEPTQRLVTLHGWIA